MKIFNWMHRKLHPGGVIKYSQVSQYKKDVSGGDEEVGKREVLLEGVMAEKEALLLHDVLNGAILAIGTLGRDDCGFLPQFYSAEEDEGVLDVPPAAEKEENINTSEETDKKEEVVLRVMETAASAFAADSAAVESVKFKAPPAESQDKKRKKMVQEMAMQAERAEEAERIIQELPLLKEDREKRERGRTTLADLFAADHFFSSIDPSDLEMNGNKGGASDRAKLKQHAAAVANSSEKKKTEKNRKEEKWPSVETIRANNTNCGSSSSNSNSNRKIQKLVTKMLKKKIHPEILGAQKATAACNCKERD